MSQAKTVSGSRFWPILLALIDIALLIWIVTAYRDKKAEERAYAYYSSIAAQTTAGTPAAPAGTTAAVTKKSETTAKPAQTVPAQTSAAQTTTAAAGSLRDPGRYATSGVPGQADFAWITQDSLDGEIPAGVERLTDFREVTGPWKCYVQDITQGGESSYVVQTFLNITIDGKKDECTLLFDWGYTCMGNTGEQYDDPTPDSEFSGSWSDGGMTAFGVGSVEITGFWYADGQEFAVGEMHWPDGTSGSLMMVRP